MTSKPITPTAKSTAAKATEERLDQIRQEAADATQSTGRSNTAQPRQIRGRESYYGLPVLKAPVWTWEVPLYFFIGGVAGISACIALAAHCFGNDVSLIRYALWIALIGAALCPIFLISDLGRPSRFLNMLRVAKIRSPMSVGAWVLVAFSGCVFLAVLAQEIIVRGDASELVVVLGWIGQISGALTGLVLAAYTGVLIAATAIPVWSRNREAIPAHFLTSALGSSGAILELFGFLIPATQIIGLVAAGIEVMIGMYFEMAREPVNKPLHQGKSGIAFRIAGILAGPGALVLRLMSSAASFRDAAAICFLCGALLSRYAWVWAGPASVKDPAVLFQMQRKAQL